MTLEELHARMTETLSHLSTPQLEALQARLSAVVADLRKLSPTGEAEKKFSVTVMLLAIDRELASRSP